MDTEELRRHVARVLVEGLLRRRGFRSARVAAGTGAERRDTLLVWKPMPRDEPLRMLTMAVTYCPDVERALAEDASLSAAGPDGLDYRIVVTDRPAAGRACFQAVVLTETGSGTALATVDLREVRALGMDRKTVEEHEELVRRLFPVLSGTPFVSVAPQGSSRAPLTGPRH